MSKILINDLLDVTSFLNDANERFQQIEEELNNNVLYRNNPPLEPNGMFNDLDMQEHNIFNVDTLQTGSIVIGGIAFDPDAEVFVPWGNITGNIQDQEDLALRLLDLQVNKLGALNLGPTSNTELALDLSKAGDIATLELSNNTNKNFGGLVQLNTIGKIPNELILMSITNLQGMWRGDDECPKPLDDQLTPPEVTNCDPGNDTRNPTELYAQYSENIDFAEGDLYILLFSGASLGNGNMNLVNEQDPLSDVIQPVQSGDAIIFLNAKQDSAGTPLAKEGWYRWAGAVSQSTALDTITDTTNFDNILSEDEVNVQAALDIIDDKAVDQATVDAGDLILQNQINDNLAQINLNITAISDNATAIGNLVTEQGVQDGLIDDNRILSEANAALLVTVQEDIGILQSSKIGRNDYSGNVGEKGGTVRFNYDAVNNILNIHTTAP